MIKIGALALAAASLCAVPAAAGADDPNFAAFHRVCIATHAMRAQALAAADAEGLVVPPAAFSDRIGPPHLSLSGLEMRVKLVPNGLLFMFVGVLDTPPPFDSRYRAEMCVVGVSPIDPVAEKAAADWAGVSAAEVADDHQMALFVGDEQAHEPAGELDSDAAAAAARAGALQMLGAGHKNDMSLMMYGVFRPAEPR